MNNIKVDISFYNADKFIERCLMSVLTQDYQNFHIILINDGSNDNSDKIIQEILKVYSDKITYINNIENMGAMYNHQNMVLNYCEPNDIVVNLDGDDWLSNSNVLSYINDFYKSNDCWLMYGQYKFLSSGRYGTSKPYLSEEMFEKKRELDFMVSHIRTFKAFTFQEIKNQDPELNCFKDSNGDWYSMTCDVAMMYPLMEICGYEKVKYNDKVLYIYNDTNPISDVKKDMGLQLRIHNEINNKPKFKKLNKWVIV
jgi:glycosyltransferase involved in cell wall biosynthesis